MVITDKVANVEFTKEELELLQILSSERCFEMRGKLEKCDWHKFIQVKELSAKLDAILQLIINKKVQKQKQDESKVDNKSKITHVPF